MGLTLGTGASAGAVFLQGLLSFFSPCVLPLVPLYIGYLAGGAKEIRRKTVLLNTVFFIIGVSFAFFALGFGFSALGRFFSGSRDWFSRIGGVLIILFGLFQLGLFGRTALDRERRLPLRLDKLAMNPAVALLFGFTFSFAWTPCVGPALASVLLLASSTASQAAGFALIGIYTVGFTLPFLAVGLFTERLLALFREKQNIVRYTVKAGGVLLVLMGVLMLTGMMNSVTGYLSQFGAAAPPPAQSQTEGSAAQDSASAPPSAPTEREIIPAPDFTLTDQYGNTHTLSDYKGKTVFLNFWATWCSWCEKEMPDIEQLYQDHEQNSGDVIILGVAAPDAGDESEEVVTQFLKDGGYTYPTVMDHSGETFSAYAASGLPTTFMIDADGNVFGYVAGMLTRADMDSIIAQAQAVVPE